MKKSFYRIASSWMVILFGISCLFTGCVKQEITAQSRLANPFYGHLLCGC